MISSLVVFLVVPLVSPVHAETVKFKAATAMVTCTNPNENNFACTQPPSTMDDVSVELDKAGNGSFAVTLTAGAYRFPIDINITKFIARDKSVTYFFDAGLTSMKGKDWNTAIITSGLVLVDNNPVNLNEVTLTGLAIGDAKVSYMPILMFASQNLKSRVVQARSFVMRRPTEGR